MVTIKLLVEGGKMAPGPAVAQKLGPMGINMGKVISDVNIKTASFKGMNVPVVLDIDSKTKEVRISVLTPSTSALLKGEAGIETASGARLKIKCGNLAFEQVISVAKQKHDSMLSNDFFASVKSVLGSCQSLGLLVDSKEISDLMVEVNEGKYDAMIKAKKTELDPDKAAELKEYFANIEKLQSVAKAEAAAAAAEKKKK